MKLRQFDQGEQVGGMRGQGLIKVAQIQQIRTLVAQIGLIESTVSGLSKAFIGIPGDPQITTGAAMALDLTEDPRGLAAARRPGKENGVAHGAATQASSWALRVG
jgi:hypothetical protein